jgi:hypothetical protein
MPPYKKKYVYRSPYENEYIFHQLVNYPEWAIKLLTAGEQKIFQNQSSIRKFVNGASGDHIKLVLAKANIFSINLYVDFNKDVPIDIKSFNKIYRQFSNVKNRKQVIDEIINHNMFAVSTREVLSFAYLVAQNCHTPYWFINKDYKRVYDAVTKVKNANLNSFDGTTDADKLKETYRARKIIANFVNAVLSAENYIRVHLQLDWMDVQIFSLLFIFPDTFVHRETITERLYMYSPKTVSNRLLHLQREGYIDSSTLSHKRITYTMAEPGIRIYCDYIEKICNQAVEI